MLMMYLSLIEDEGDQIKFEQIYHAYSRLMRYRAYQILKDEYLAEDAVHQAFLKIINSLDKIVDVKCNKTKHFLVVVVERVAIDLYNKEHKIGSVSFEEYQEMRHLGENEDMTEKAGLNEVEEIIYKLPTPYRELFVLKFCCGYENKEISKVLGIKEGTIRQRLVRGRKILMEELKGAGLYEDGKD